MCYELIKNSNDKINNKNQVSIAGVVRQNVSNKKLPEIKTQCHQLSNQKSLKMGKKLKAI